MRIRTLRLQGKLTLLCVVLAVVPLAVLGGVAIEKTDRTIRTMADEKVRTDLRSGHDRFYSQLERQRSLISGVRDGQALSSLAPAALGEVLERVVETGRLDLVAVTDARGRVVQWRGPRARGASGDLGWSALTRQALAGTAASAFEVAPASFLGAHGLAEAASLTLVETPKARKPPYPRETRALMIRSAVPLVEDGRVVGTLQAASLVNNRFEMADAIGDALSQTCTVFLDDIRVTTNVKKADGTRAIGTMVSTAVADQVLGQGITYFGRAFVVKDWYLSAYEPIVDGDGRRIGIFYVGIAEAPFNALKQGMITQVAIALLILGGLAALGGAWFARRLTRPLETLGASIQIIAGGRLSDPIPVLGDDEVGALGRAVDQMRGHLQRVIVHVREVAHSVKDRADLITTNTQGIAQGAQVQAGITEDAAGTMAEMLASMQHVGQSARALSDNVETTGSAISGMATQIHQVAGNVDSLASAVDQTSAAIEEIIRGFQVVASNVDEAHRIVGASAGAAQEGRRAVTQTVDGMGSIGRAMHDLVTVIEGLGRRSHEIGSIIAVIDDIADQTNLLALNAAIEAARAGEHGKGFAVVADEVRKLAERSAKATAEITQLIKGIQGETQQAVDSTREGERTIQDGALLAQQAGEALEGIVRSVEQASGLMAEVTRATREQSTAATQITSAIHDMTRLTHQVHEATGQQAEGSSAILAATSAMGRMTQQVAQATREQQLAGERVAKGVDAINGATHEASAATREMAQSAVTLQAQASELLDAIAFFEEAKAAPAPRLEGDGSHAVRALSAGVAVGPGR